MMKDPPSSWWLCSAFLLAIMLMLSGCGRTLVATPNLYIGSDTDPFAQTPERLRTTELPVFYVTDRARIEDDSTSIKYGIGRTLALEYGFATMAFGQGGTWDDLVADSRRRDRSRPYPLKLVDVRAVGKVADRSARLELLEDGRFSVPPESQEDMDRVVNEFVSLLSEQLAGTQKKDVYIFVHGVNNTFEHTVGTTAMIWHFMGREGLAIAYSWPAGREGVLRGYTYDRESSEYTVTHFKGLLRGIAMCPDVERVHIIGHSRGTNVVTSAIRELAIEFRAKGESLKDALRLQTLVLAAPDLDLGVFRQRFSAELEMLPTEQFALYTAPQDKAISVAEWLFSSVARLGQLSPEHISKEGQTDLRRMPRLQVIWCDVSGYSSSHNYFYAHPAALSDLILLVRDRRKPGPENGRPLRRDESGFWLLGNDYPGTSAVSEE